MASLRRVSSEHPQTRRPEAARGAPCSTGNAWTWTRWGPGGTPRPKGTHPGSERPQSRSPCGRGRGAPGQTGPERGALLTSEATLTLVVPMPGRGLPHGKSACNRVAGPLAQVCSCRNTSASSESRSLRRPPRAAPAPLMARTRSSAKRPGQDSQLAAAKASPPSRLARQTPAANEERDSKENAPLTLDGRQRAAAHERGAERAAQGPRAEAE